MYYVGFMFQLFNLFHQSVLFNYNIINLFHNFNRILHLLLPIMLYIIVHESFVENCKNSDNNKTALNRKLNEILFGAIFMPPCLHCLTQNNISI